MCQNDGALGGHTQALGPSCWWLEIRWQKASSIPGRIRRLFTQIAGLPDGVPFNMSTHILGNTHTCRFLIRILGAQYEDVLELGPPTCRGPLGRKGVGSNSIYPAFQARGDGLPHMELRQKQCKLIHPFPIHPQAPPDSCPGAGSKAAGAAP